MSTLVRVADDIARKVLDNLPPNTILFSVHIGGGHESYFCLEQTTAVMELLHRWPRMPLTSRPDADSRDREYNLPQSIRRLTQMSELVDTLEPCQEELRNLRCVAPDRLQQSHKLRTKAAEEDSRRVRLQALNRVIAREEMQLKTEFRELRMTKLRLTQGVLALRETASRLGYQVGTETDDDSLTPHPAAATQSVSAILSQKRRMYKETTDFVMARKLKLVSQMRSIYPISVEKTSIGGIRLPLDDVTVHRDPDEQIATALGYISHLVLMLSKYWEIPLRYQVFPKASRSTMRSHNGVFPLYGKGEDANKFNMAVWLLGQDILQLMVKRNLDRKIFKRVDLSHGRYLIHNMNQLMVHFNM